MCSNVFRTLRADEIDVRVQQVKKSNAGKVFAQLLLYKDARVDMMLLDEQYGTFGWQREHFFKDGKNYCKVSAYDNERKMWVVKEDVGIPSNTEAQKGEASDAFKRACVNFGIGRELYTAPRLVIELNQGEWYEADNGKGGKTPRLSNRTEFFVNAIDYDERRCIIAIEIVDNNGRSRIKIGTINSPLFQAKAEMNASKTYEEAKAIWLKYPEHHLDAGFLAAKEMKKEQFTQPAI